MDAIQAAVSASEKRVLTEYHGHSRPVPPPEKMPRMAAKARAQDGATGAGRVNLSALNHFARDMKAKNMDHIWRGRRTGLMIDDTQVSKDLDGLDNIDSFWDSARLDGPSSPGTASLGPSTPGSAFSQPVSPGSGGSAAWAGADAGGDEDTVSEEGGGEGVRKDAEEGEGEEEEEAGLPAKRLEYPPDGVRAEPAATRSEVSTDEELVAERNGEVGEGGEGVAGEGAEADMQDGRPRRKGAASASRTAVTEVATPADAADVAGGGGEGSGKASPRKKSPASARGGPARGSGGKGRVSVSAATPRRASSRRGSGGGGDVVVAAATRSGGKERVEQAGDDQSSDDDNDDGGGGWGFGDLGGPESDDDGGDLASPRSKIPIRLPFEDTSATWRASRGSSRTSPSTRGSAGKKSASSPPAPATPTPATASPPPRSRKKDTSSTSPRRSRDSGEGGGGSGGGTGSGVGTPVGGAAKSNGKAKVKTRGSASKSPSKSASKSSSKSAAKSPAEKSPAAKSSSVSKSPAVSKSASKSPAVSKTQSPPVSSGKGKDKGKGKGKGKGRGNDEEEEEEGGEQEGVPMMMDVGGEDEKSPFSPPGDDSEEAPSSPYTRGSTKKEKKNPAVAAKKGTKKGENKAAAKGKHRRQHVVSRLSSGGPGRRGGSGKGAATAATAAAPSTPGPSRSKGSPRFVDISEVAEVSHTPGVRRSGRQRVAPLKWWKGDNIQYGVDEAGLLVAEGIVKGRSTTPAPSSRKRKDGSGGRKRKRTAEPMSPLSPSQLTALPKAGKYMQKEEECVVWNEETADSIRRHVVMRSRNLVNHQLTATLDRPSGKDKVGAAAQAFNVPTEVGISEWLSGRLELPHGAIKDSEHVAHSSQIYVVGEGQPNALELAIAKPTNRVNSNIFDPKTAQRFLLSPGDHFFVPVNNIYRLENHSKKAKAVIYWTILKCPTS